MLIQKIFKIKRTMDVLFDVYTITAVRRCSDISKVCDSILGDTNNYLSLKGGEKSCSNHQNTKNSRFSNSITNTYIKTIDNHYQILKHRLSTFGNVDRVSVTTISPRNHFWPLIDRWGNNEHSKSLLCICKTCPI